MNTQTMLAIFAIVAALGLLGIVVMESSIIPYQHAEARGCFPGSTGFNSSQARCFH